MLAFGEKARRYGGSYRGRSGDLESEAEKAWLGKSGLFARFGSDMSFGLPFFHNLYPRRYLLTSYRAIFAYRSS